MNNILQGNVNDKLKEIESNSVQCVVTSPPYWGLRDYGTASWDGGDENCDHKMPPTGGPGLNRSGHSRDGYYSKVCKKCGASVFFKRFNSKAISISAGLFKNPTKLKTVSHIYTANMRDYYKISDNLPKYKKYT